MRSVQRSPPKSLASIRRPASKSGFSGTRRLPWTRHSKACRRESRRRTQLSFGYAKLQNEADSNRATLQAFSIYRAKMAGAPSIEQTNVDIVSPAVPGTKPISPNRKVILGFVGVVALFGSVVAAIVRASLVQNLRSAEQAGALLGLRTLALVPKVRSSKPDRPSGRGYAGLRVVGIDSVPLHLD